MTEKKTTAKDSGEAQVQEAFDEAAEQGFFGHSPDKTPRENYTLQTPPDAPTPELEQAKQRAKEAGR